MPCHIDIIQVVNMYAVTPGIFCGITGDISRAHDFGGFMIQLVNHYQSNASAECECFVFPDKMKCLDGFYDFFCNTFGLI